LREAVTWWHKWKPGQSVKGAPELDCMVGAVLSWGHTMDLEAAVEANGIGEYSTRISEWYLNNTGNALYLSSNDADHHQPLFFTVTSKHKTVKVKKTLRNADAVKAMRKRQDVARKAAKALATANAAAAAPVPTPVLGPVKGKSKGKGKQGGKGEFVDRQGYQRNWW
jgi:hypothetical protein